MGGIFISYRRADSGPSAGRLRDTLSNHFGADQVFRDIDRINPGERFPRVIENAVGSCDALLAVIGPKWLSITDDDRNRRLDDPKDYLRREIVAALERPDVLVIPVLVGQVSMPGADDLPAELAALTDCNAVRVTDEGWGDQVAHLIKALETVVRPTAVAAPPAPAPPAQPAPPQPRPYSSQPAASAPPPWAASSPAPSRSRFPVGIVMAVVAGLVVFGGLAFAAVTVFSGVSNKIDGPGGPGRAEPTVVLTPTSGPPGTTVTVVGTGYGSQETVDIILHAEEVGTVQANPDGSFTAEITIPDTPFRGQQFDISANGQRTIRHDSAPFRVT